MRLAFIAAMLVASIVPSLAHAETEDPDEAYKACILGHAVISVYDKDTQINDAFALAQKRCKSLEKKTSDADAVMEEVVHFWDGVLAQRCK